MNHTQGSEEKPTREYRLDLGGTVISFDCFPPPFGEYLGKWFDRPSSTANAHAQIGMELVPHEESLDLPNSLLRNKQLSEDGHFDISDGLFTGWFDKDTGQGHIAAKAAVSHGQLMRVMEQIFYQAYFSARSISGQDSFLIHSSAVIADGQGFLFVGPSEAGKTTAALNSSEHHVLGDEMNLVHFTEQGLILEGTPFNGTFRDKKPGRAPLKGIFLLEQASENEIVAIGPAEAGSLLAAEVVPPVGLGELPGADTVPAMVDAAARISAKLPLDKLRLKNEPFFWQAIAKKHGLDIS